MTADVGKDLGFQSELGDGDAVLTGLFGCRGGGEFEVVDADFVKGAGNLDFLFGIEEGVGKLFALCKGEWTGL